jgi:GTP-binding protein EngB required for normal cell division
MNEANLDFFTIDYPPDFGVKYFQSLFQCSLISELIYADDPRKALESHQCNHLNHGIKSFCVSKTIDDKRSESNFDVKYMICDCSKNNDEKRLIIGFRGTSSFQDFLVDLDLIGQINECEGSFHSGVYKRSKKIPIKHFIEKLLNENYEIIFTGHSLGAAIASLVTVEVLTHKAVLVDSVIKNVQFIGFGSPLVACSKFKRFIEKYENNFHFYGNEKDIIPKLISILSSTIHSKPEIKDQVDNNPDLINVLKKFIKKLMNPFDIINEEIILSKIFNFAMPILAQTFVPAYEHFGKYFLIRDISYLNDNKNIKSFKIENSEFREEINKIKMNNIDTLIELYKLHSIKKYYEMLKPFFEKKINNLVINNGPVQLKHQVYENLFISKEFVKSKNEDLIRIHDGDHMGKVDQNGSYEIKVYENRSHWELCITLSGKNIEYLIGSKLFHNNGVYDLIKSESNRTDTIQYGFNIEKIFSRQELKSDSKKFKLKLLSHFNIVDIEIVISPEDLKTGLTYREESISNISPDLLYIYGTFYIYILNKLGDNLSNNLKTQCETLTKLFGELDDIWNIKDKENEEQKEKDFKKEIFFEEMINRFLDVDLNIYCNTNSLNQDSRVDLKPKNFFNKIFNEESKKFNLFLKYVSIKDKIDEIMKKEKGEYSKELLECIIPTTNKLRELQSKKLKIRDTTKTEIASIASGTIISVISLFTMKTSIFLSGLAAGAYGAYNLANLYNLSNQKNIDYLFNIGILMEGFKIKKYDGLPYLAHCEKRIYEEYDKVKGKNLKENWNVFENSEYISNICEEEKDNLIKILKSIAINYQIREVLKREFFFGIIGQSKSGKSTFLEKLLPGENANATSREPTTEIKPFEIVDGVTILDYPHFDSTDINHQLQFLFSRFLLDYVFFVCRADDRTDLKDVNMFLELSNVSFKNRFIVLLNKADSVWRETKNGDVTYRTVDLEDTKSKVAEKLGKKSLKRVFLTCLNYEDLDEYDVDSLIMETEIKTIKTLKKIVINKMMENISNEDTKKNLLDTFNKMNSLSQKKISVGVGDVDLHLHLLNQFTCKSQNVRRHIDVKNDEELKNKIKGTFKINNPTLVAVKNPNVHLSTFEDLLNSDYHAFNILEN